MYPDGFASIAVFVLFVAPGIMFTTVRVALVGVRTTDLSAAGRVLEALFVGVLFDALYALIFFSFVRDLLMNPSTTLRHVDFGEIVSAIVVLLIVPAGVAALSGLRIRRLAVDAKDAAEIRKRAAERARRREAIARRLGFYVANNYRSIPVAWDYKALEHAQAQFVRVRMEDGRFYGGYYGGGSYMSTYPHPRDIFISNLWRVDSDGTFKHEIAASRGIWLPITDRCAVEWIEAPVQPSIEEVK
jgi:Family of unknown function (DUF6338)